MFFQEITPDTSGYMIAGYATAFIILALYVVSLYLRNRNLDQDLSVLAEMEPPSKPEAKAQKKPAKTVTKVNRKK